MMVRQQCLVRYTICTVGLYIALDPLLAREAPPDRRRFHRRFGDVSAPLTRMKGLSAATTSQLFLHVSSTNSPS